MEDLRKHVGQGPEVEVTPEFFERIFDILEAQNRALKELHSRAQAAGLQPDPALVQMQSHLEGLSTDMDAAVAEYQKSRKADDILNVWLRMFNLMQDMQEKMRQQLV